MSNTREIVLTLAKLSFKPFPFIVHYRPDRYADIVLQADSPWIEIHVDFDEPLGLEAEETIRGFIERQLEAEGLLRDYRCEVDTMVINADYDKTDTGEFAVHEKAGFVSGWVPPKRRPTLLEVLQAAAKVLDKEYYVGTP